MQSVVAGQALISRQPCRCSLWAPLPHPDLSPHHHGTLLLNLDTSMYEITRGQCTCGSVSLENGRVSFLDNQCRHSLRGVFQLDSKRCLFLTPKRAGVSVFRYCPNVHTRGCYTLFEEVGPFTRKTRPTRRVRVNFSIETRQALLSVLTFIQPVT